MLSLPPWRKLTFADGTSSQILINIVFDLGVMRNSIPIPRFHDTGAAACTHDFVDRAYIRCSYLFLTSCLPMDVLTHVCQHSPSKSQRNSLRSSHF